MFPEELLKRELGGENVNTDMLERLCYSRDMSVHRGVPEAIVTPVSAEMVSKLVKIASHYNFAVIARGAGSSVTGAIIPIKPAVICDLSRMNKIKEINREDGYAVVEPGVICADLNAAVAPGAFFAPDPGSSSVATIGGMVATNASGLRAVKYGTTKDHTLSLEVVLADGSIIKTGNLAPKSSFGYDLTRLFVASEGTLGIITEITVKLTPAPQHIAMAVAYFNNLENAVKSVSEIISKGISLSICEIMDRSSINVINRVLQFGLLPAEAMLTIEVDGNRLSVQDDIQKVVSICNRNGAINTTWTDKNEERAKLWNARKGLVPSLSRVKAGARLIPLAEDFGVPISAIPKVIRGSQEIARKYDVLLATFGHVGDGNVHTTFIGDVRDKENWKKLRTCTQELFELVAGLNGTLSAEHGIGIAKSPFAETGLGNSIDVMRKIKLALDPKGILNPGKLGIDESVKDIYDYFAFNELLSRKQNEFPLGEGPENELLLCVECGFCRTVCPTFKATNLESMNTRGRNILAFGICDGTLSLSPELGEKFFTCTTCLNCLNACPSKIDIEKIVHSIREKLWEKGCAPETLKSVVSSIKINGNPLNKLPSKRMDFYPPEKIEAKSRGEYTKGKILLWFGCIPSYLDPKIVSSTIKIMESAKADYFFLGNEEKCCGYVIYQSGDPQFEEVALKVAQHIKNSKAEFLVTPCSGCYRTFKQIYSKFSPLEIQILHIIEFIDMAITEGKIKLNSSFPSTLIYHDPCDLGRHMNMYDVPRKILNLVSGGKLIEFNRNKSNALCCGAGGGVSASNGKLSISVSDLRVAEASQCHAGTIVSACPGCKSNLSKSATRLKKKLGSKISVVDITEVVADCI